MSYGVWRRRGAGWSSIEIDSPWNYTFHDMSMYSGDKESEALRRKTGSFWDDNPHYARWELGQRNKGREIKHLNTGGEHSLSVSYDDEDALSRALEKLSFLHEGDEKVLGAPS